jgi:DNA-binding response OmpR family regulator
MVEHKKQPSVLLIATEGEWAGRSLESVLVSHGYAVMRAQDGHSALAWARRARPDAVILDESLPGIGGIEVCRLLRDDPMFDPATPIIITASAPASRSIRMAAYSAGAWEFCTQPLDTETLFLELDTFIRAKRAIESAREQSLVDATTGVLTPLGMERWAAQLAARALRNHEALACVALMPSRPSFEPETEDLAESVAVFIEASRAHMRRSDIIGRMSDGRLALLAPDTDGVGVLRLVQRLRTALDVAAKARPGSRSSEFRAGYCAVDDFSTAPVEPFELMRRAASALDHVHRTHGQELALSFDQLPVS